ncbi:uncharacterized protein LOC132194588 [Neocloeon triangulifer]|uniref:uncharacterized protein LOC132194588 n=1 Tax=Neocloeon triangulifer TaxID=2078957 RepID=UPI00286F5C8E|nr:uncharacterized protein LOC132194588 [Neocloeon triangulifer]
MGTVRALHQTVVGLRTALESCKQQGELLSSQNRELRERLRMDDDDDELDDIELIFTTEGAGSVPPQEPLESITEDGGPPSGAHTRYRPLVHRDALRATRAPAAPRSSAGAQTDVTAVQWRSEGFLNRRPLRPILGPRANGNNTKPLSNLGFTAMVPELSRSVDHDLARPPPRTVERWPCECLAASAHHWDSLRSPWCDKERRRFSWRTAQSSAETNRGTLTRNSAVWGSVPASPDVPPPGPFIEWAGDEQCCCCRRRVFLSSPSLAAPPATWLVRGSLPDLRAPEQLMLDLRPPLTSRPFLPRQLRDLKEDCLAKVIGPENRVLVGRVRFVGSASAAGFKEPVVGLEVAEYGDSDGTVNGHRLFSCEQGRGLFVPFRKVILAWHC